MRSRSIAAALSALVLGVLLGGCGNDAQSAVNRRATPTADYTATPVGGVQPVEVHVNATYRFYPSHITVHPGTVHIVLVHTGSGAPHDLQVVGFPGDYAPIVNPGGRSQVTFTAPAPGNYRFECTIHVRQGQVGTLTVLSS